MSFTATWNATTQQMTINGITGGSFQYSLNGRTWITVTDTGTLGSEIFNTPSSWSTLYFRDAPGQLVQTVTYAAPPPVILSLSVNEGTDTVTVTGATGGFFQYSLNGGASWVTANAAGGSGSFVVTGTGTVNVQVRDNLTATVQTTSVAVNAPTVPFVVTPDDATDTVSVTGATGGFFQYSLDGGRSWVTVQAPEGAGSFVVTGTGMVDVLVRDNSISTATSISVDVNPTANTLGASFVDTAPAGVTDGLLTEDKITNNGTVSVSNVSGGSFQYSLDGGRSWLTVSTGGTTGSFSVTGDGAKSVLVRDTTTGPSTPLSFTLDTTVAGPSAVVTNVTDTVANVTRDTRITVTLAADPNGVASWAYSIDGGGNWSAPLLPATLSVNPWDNVDAPLTNGPLSVQVRQTDNVGNVSAPTILTFTYDATLTVGVGREFATIQAAVNAAVAGNSILVAAGAYSETVTVGKAGLTIKMDADAVLTGGFDVQAAGTGFALEGGEIKGGALLAGIAGKQGIFVRPGADISVTDTKFDGTGSTGQDRAIEAGVGASKIIVDGATFTNWAAAAIYVNPGDELTVTNSSFTGNLVGIGTDGPAKLVVTGSTFGNTLEGVGLTAGKVIGTFEFTGNTFAETAQIPLANNGLDTGLTSVAAVSNIIFVTAGGNIQAAINAVPAGGTVIVGPGTYSGTITVGKAGLTIKMDADAVLTGGFDVQAAGTGFALEGGEIKGGALLAGIAGKQGIFVRPGADISVTDTKFDGTGSTGQDRAIEAGVGASKIIVDGATFTNWAAAAIYVNPGDELTVTNSSFTGNLVGIGTDGPAKLVVTGSNFDNTLEGVGLTAGKVIGTFEFTGNTFADTAQIPLAYGGASTGVESQTLVSNVLFVTAGQSIQAAINAIPVGGTIIVGPGTYNENILINKVGITLLAADGRTATTIVGSDTSARLGTIQIAAGINNVTIDGFKIEGINGNGAVEKAAVYITGANTGFKLLNSEVVAKGDAGLMSEFGGALVNAEISGNIFSGKTFVGDNPQSASNTTFTGQFDIGSDFPRQLVVLGNGGGTNASVSDNVQFTNNLITGTAGGISAQTGLPFGNTLVTIDVSNAKITGNTFTGVTGAGTNPLRARRDGTEIKDNVFDQSNGGQFLSGVFVQNNTTGTISGNQFIGSTAANVMIGTSGADIISPLAGNDMLTGGAGADRFVFLGPDIGVNTITDFGNGADVIDFSAYEGLTINDLVLSVVSSDTVITAGGATPVFTGSITLAGYTTTLSSSDFIFAPPTS